MRRISPLSYEEQKFAEEHHNMIFRFLSTFGLDAGEYYDVVVFGYLAAVHEYLQKPQLQQNYSFTTISWRQMYRAFLDDCTYRNREIRKARMASYHEDLALQELDAFLPGRTTAIEEQLNDREIALELLSYLTPKEKEIVFLKADGYSHAEIAQRCHITVHGVRSRIARFRSRLLAPPSTHPGGNVA